MQAARLATEQVEAAVHAAEESFKEGNTLDATAKAAVAAWRSSQVRLHSAVPALVSHQQRNTSIAG